MRSSQEELEVHRTFIKVFLEDLLCVRYYSRHWWCNDVYESLCCDNIQVTTYLQYTWHLHIEFGKKSRLQNGVSLANNSLIDVWISIQGEGLSQENRRMRNSLSYCVPFFLWSGNQGINSSCSQNIWKGEIRREEYFFGQEGPQGHNEAHWQELISEDSTESSARQSQRGGGSPSGPGKGRSGGDTQLGTGDRGRALLKLESQHRQSRADWEKETDPQWGSFPAQGQTTDWDSMAGVEDWEPGICSWTFRTVKAERTYNMIQEDSTKPWGQMGQLNWKVSRVHYGINDFVNELKT